MKRYESSYHQITSRSGGGSKRPYLRVAFKIYCAHPIVLEAHNHIVPYDIFYNHSLVITAIIHLLDFCFPWNKTHESGLHAIHFGRIFIYSRTLCKHAQGCTFSEALHFIFDKHQRIRQAMCYCLLLCKQMQITYMSWCIRPLWWMAMDAFAIGHVFELKLSGTGLSLAWLICVNRDLVFLHIFCSFFSFSLCVRVCTLFHLTILVFVGLWSSVKSV